MRQMFGRSVAYSEMLGGKGRMQVEVVHSKQAGLAQDWRGREEKRDESERVGHAGIRGTRDVSASLSTER
jgi:hypothetical protein